MIATLPMYDLPEIRDATDAWWSALARALRAADFAGVPDTLARATDPLEAWMRPDLLLGQTCGYPLVTHLDGRVRLVGTPVYAAPGCVGARYLSLLVVREGLRAARMEDLRGSRCAYNDPRSLSGCVALRAMVAPLARERRFFATARMSGSHRASLALLASGEADVCAVDCVTHALLARHDPAALRGTRVLCRTAGKPGLPYVTAGTASDPDLARLRGAVAEALADPVAAAARRDLLIVGFETLERPDYRSVERVAALASELSPWK